MAGKKGFTLVELAVTILIVAILAAAVTPLLQARTQSAMWAEANASAGTIRTAVRALVAVNGPSHDYSQYQTALTNANTASALGFHMQDLTGSYFNQADYSIQDIDPQTGTCLIIVNGSGSQNPQAPYGTGQLLPTGQWVVSQADSSSPTPQPPADPSPSPPPGNNNPGPPTTPPGQGNRPGPPFTPPGQNR